MPRKKTIQPKPLEEFTLPDGMVVEVRDWRTREIGRGLKRKFESDELEWQVLNGLADDERSGNPALVLRARQALASNHAMERFLRDAGYEFEERTGRRHGKSIRDKHAGMMQIVAAIEYDSWQVLPTPSPKT